MKYKSNEDIIERNYKQGIKELKTLHKKDIKDMNKLITNLKGQLKNEEMLADNFQEHRNRIEKELNDLKKDIETKGKSALKHIELVGMEEGEFILRIKKLASLDEEVKRLQEEKNNLAVVFKKEINNYKIANKEDIEEKEKLFKSAFDEKNRLKKELEDYKKKVIKFINKEIQELKDDYVSGMTHLNIKVYIGDLKELKQKLRKNK